MEMASSSLHPRREFRVTLEDGASVAVRAFGEGPRLIFGHGNGLAIDAYRVFWERFLPDFEVVIFDFRHHGRSSPYIEPVRNWPQFISDFGVVLDAIRNELGPTKPIGVFHSMSALTCLMHAGSRQSDWRALALFEPPIRSPSSSEEFETFHAGLVEAALRRRESFHSPDRLFESYRGRPAFGRLSDAVLRDLVASTLRESKGAAGMEWVLACDRRFEAETFRLADLPADAWAIATGLSCPTLVVSSDPASGQPPILPEAAASLAEAGGYAHRRVTDSTHFLQTERPEICSALVRQFIGALPALPA